MTPLHLATGVLDLETGLLTRPDGDRVQLSPQERALLEYVAERPNQDLSRSQLAADVLGYSKRVRSRAVDHAVKLLRLKIEQDPARPGHLIGVDGLGYRFVPTGGGPRPILALGALRVDLDRLEVQGPQGVVGLSANEGALLGVLAAAAGRPVPVEDLLREVWGVRDPGRRRLVSRAVHRLRAKLPGEDALRTVRGRGVLLQVDRAPPELMAVPWTCAPPAVRVVGRGDARDELERLLEPESAVVSVVGPGGVGKSTLALWVASQWEQPALWVDLRSAGLGVAATLAAALGVDQPSDAGADPVAHALNRAGAPLVVVDNAEAAAEQVAAVVQDMRQRAPRVRWIVTSRWPLKVAGERVLRLGGLPPAAAAQVFRDRGGEDHTALGRLLEQLQFLPLAIEIAAARSQLLGVDGLLKRLDDPLRVLRGGVEPHASLEAVLDLSWRRLSLAERRTLAGCALLPGGLSVDAAEAIGEGPDVLDRLQVLVERSLIARDGHGRLGFSLAVAEFASAQLAGDPWMEGARRRLRRWFCELAGPLPAVGWEPPPSLYPRLLVELEAALVVARDAPRPDAARILLWALPVLSRRSMHQRAQTHLRAFGDPAVLPLALMERMLWCFSAVSFRAGHLTHALAHAERLHALRPSDRSAALLYGRRMPLDPSIDLPVVHGSPAMQQVLYEGAYRLGDDPHAWMRFMQARLAFTQRAGLAWAESDARLRLASGPGGRPQADAIRHARRIADPHRVAGLPDPPAFYGMLGAIKGRQGELEDARRLCMHAHAQASRLGSVAHTGWSAAVLGRLTGAQGDYLACVEWFTEAMRCAEEQGDAPRAALMCSNLGEAHRRAGQDDVARELLLRSAALFEQMGDVRSRALPLRSLGRLELEAGNLQAADEALVQVVGQGDAAPAAALALAVHAEVRCRLGDPEAWATVEAATEAGARGDREWLGHILVHRTRIARLTERDAAAQDALERLRQLVLELALPANAELSRAVEGLGQRSGAP